MSNSVPPYGLQPSRFLCPWDVPGKNTKVGCHFFSRGSSRLRGWTQVSCIAGRFLTIWATRRSPENPQLGPNSGAERVYKEDLDEDEQREGKPGRWAYKWANAPVHEVSTPPAQHAQQTMSDDRDEPNPTPCLTDVCQNLDSQDVWGFNKTCLQTWMQSKGQQTNTKTQVYGVIQPQCSYVCCEWQENNWLSPLYLRKFTTHGGITQGLKSES